MSKRIEAFDKLIDNHQHRHIPLELGQVIQQGIRAGKNAREKRKQHLKWLLRLMLIAVTVLAIFGISINVSPEFNQKMRKMPFLTNLVDMLQIGDPLNGHDIDTDYKEQSLDFVYVLSTEGIENPAVLTFIKDALISEHPKLKVIKDDKGIVHIVIGHYPNEAEALKEMERLEAFMAAQNVQMTVEKTQNPEGK